VTTRTYFVQVGATRDGLDPYLDAAHRRGMTAVLLETPDYLRWRRALGWREFDVSLPVHHLASADGIVAALELLDHRPELVLAGFERYARPTFAASAILNVRPSDGSNVFSAPRKRDQRMAMTAAGLDGFQPRYNPMNSLAELADACDGLRFPVVLKPSDGSSGLGVVLIPDIEGVPDAVAAVNGLRNYDGGPFEGWLVEEYAAGDEVSLQALAIAGHVEILTYSEKFALLERSVGHRIATFREGGHVVSPFSEMAKGLGVLVGKCIAAVGYSNGPFHIDLVRRGDAVRVLEMGFRLSGLGMVTLVERVAQVNWAEAAFRVHLQDAPPLEQSPEITGLRYQYGGQIAIRNATELRIARALQTRYGHRAVEVHTLPRPANLGDWFRETPPSMTADLRRYASGIGRMFVFHNDKTTVSSLLSHCITIDR